MMDTCKSSFASFRAEATAPHQPPGNFESNPNPNIYGFTRAVSACIPRNAKGNTDMLNLKNCLHADRVGQGQLDRTVVCLIQLYGNQALTEIFRQNESGPTRMRSRGSQG